MAKSRYFKIGIVWISVIIYFTNDENEYLDTYLNKKL